MIIAGERRYRATTLAGLATIDAIVREDVNDAGIAELALIENLLRQDLNEIEEAGAYRAMLDGGHTVESLTKLMGLKSPAKIVNRLALLKLDPAFQDAISKGAIPASQGLEMSRLNREGQFSAWRAIQDGRADTGPKLRRFVAALYDLENQEMLFRMEPTTEREKTALAKVDRFIEQAGKLLSSITEDDLTVIEEVVKSDAVVCVDRLKALVATSYTIMNALAANLAKQDATKETVQ
jgi:ParB-like chromosome segregation protein Spo0J